MAQSLMRCQVVLRVGLAIVFLWFGINKFIQPQFWVDAWPTVLMQGVIKSIGMAPADAIRLEGIFEVLVAASLVTGFFVRWFASAAVVFLVATSAIYGISDATIRSIGLIGGLVALAMWPERSRDY